ncbi:hypothetical protein GGR58DRAFT_499024 [Xylaria digitata]|nr:hypothetical protein GGR58DRAFT_499024 [Xylaria digitata]
MARLGGDRRPFAPSLSFLASCLFVLSLFGQTFGRSLCSILDQRTAIVDDRLFFCSGNYSFDDDGLAWHTTSSIHRIYLNKTIDVSDLLNTESLGSTTLPSESLLGGKYPGPGGFSGTFFLRPHDAVPICWSNWARGQKLVQVEGGRISFGENSEGVFASDPRTGTSFYTGGWVTAFNGTSNGTVKFRSSNSDRPSWSFEQALGDSMQGPNILKGSMVYVRKGAAGVLIAFGGYQTAYEGGEIPDRPWDQRPFSEIFIYDIQTSTWFHQAATGALLELRTEFCAAVSAAPDDSSFQITIHGGWDQLKRRTFNDVYVLSIPSFRWIKVEDSDNPDLAGIDQPGRNRHKCDMWNETSMIITGGEITLGEWYSSLLTESCNPDYRPIKVLDTSTYKWQTEFNPSLTYSVPKVVTDGGASISEPELGWDTEDLANIFSQTVVRDTYVPPGRLSRTNPADPAPDPETPSGPSDSSVVGAAVVFSGVFAVVFFCYRKRKYQAADQTTPSISSVTDIPLVKEWHKPELDNTTSQRYELGTENYVYEMHGHDIGRQSLIAHNQQRGDSPPHSAAH